MEGLDNILPDPVGRASKNRFIEQASIHICANICATKFTEIGDYSRLKKKENCESIAIASVNMAKALANELINQHL
jgi:hypothetical protein